MSDFEDDLAWAALIVLLDVHGESIVYRDDGGDPITLTAIVGDEQTNEVEADEGEDLERLRHITVLRNPASNYGGIAEPSLTATICAQGQTYAVKRIVVQTASHAKLEVLLRTAAEITRPKFRRRL